MPDPSKKENILTGSRKTTCTMGIRQMVRHSALTAAFTGSNPVYPVCSEGIYGVRSHVLYLLRRCKTKILHRRSLCSQCTDYTTEQMKLVNKKLRNVTRLSWQLVQW